jgi:hypothetical protein
MVSHPDAVAELIESAAEKIQTTKAVASTSR